MTREPTVVLPGSRPSDLIPNPFAAAAIHAATRLIKTRARHYARRPLALEALYPGLLMRGLKSWWRLRCILPSVRACHHGAGLDSAAR